MHELILLRHAEAVPIEESRDDQDRPLSTRGEQEAQAAGLWLAAHGVSPGELLALLDQHGDAGTVMLVGHNPGIERLVALLVEGRSDQFRGMPPGGLAILHLNGALEPGNARLDAFWSP